MTAQRRSASAFWASGSLCSAFWSFYTFVSDWRTYLVPAALWVHKHQHRLHELRGEGLHQEGLPAAILDLRTERKVNVTLRALSLTSNSLNQSAVRITTVMTSLPHLSALLARLVRLQRRPLLLLTGLQRRLQTGQTHQCVCVRARVCLCAFVPVACGP